MLTQSLRIRERLWSFLDAVFGGESETIVDIEYQKKQI
jgi:hypothetical protein